MTLTPKAYPTIGQSFLITFVLICFILIFSLFAPLLEAKFGVEVAALIIYIFSTGIPLLIFRKQFIKRNSKEERHVNKGGSVAIVLVLIIISFSVQIGIMAPIIHIIPIPESVKATIRAMPQLDNIWALITFVIAAPIIEESIFRKIILNGLLRNYSAPTAILVSSFLFAFYHMNPWQFVSAFLLGVFVGWVFFKTGNITLSILSHVANNLLAFISSNFFGLENILNKSIFELYGGVQQTIVILTICFLTIIFGLTFINSKLSSIR